MKTLLLLSSGSTITTLPPPLIAKPMSRVTIAWVTTASKGTDDTAYLARDKKRMTAAHWNFEEIDIEGKSYDALKKLLTNKDVIFVEGGNTFYLLKAIRETGFDKIVKKLTENNVVYVGSSAGAVVAGPDIWPIRFIDDPSKAKLKSFKGLNLVGFVPLPHFGNKKYSKPYTKVMEDLKKTGYKYVKIREGGAAFVKNGKVKMIKA